MLASHAKRANSEGSVYQRSDGQWCGAVTVAGRRRVFYGKTRQEASRKLVQALATIQNGLPVISGRQTVREYLADWLENTAKPKLWPKTHRSYEQLIRGHITPALGRHQLVKLEPHHVQDFLNDKAASGLSPRTVQYLHTVLRRALNQALKWGLVARNVATLIDVPRGERPEIQPFSIAQAQALVEAAETHRLGNLITVVLATGLRLGEALALQWPDVDLQADTLTVGAPYPRKAAAPAVAACPPEVGARPRRTVPLIGPASQALCRQHTRVLEMRLQAGPYWQDHGFVFPSSIGTPLGERNVQREYQQLLERAGLPPRRFHDLRHTCATFLIAADVQPRVLMQFLGHAQISLTMDTYAHVLPSALDDASERLAAIFPRTSKTL